MKAAVLAGILYFAIVFTAGFCLGVIRTFVVSPVLGETFGVVLELPAMLVISWLVSRNVINRLCVQRTMVHALTMGGLGLILLLAAEAALSALTGRTMFEHLLLYTATPGLLGLAGQVAFAAFPLIQVQLAHSRHR